MKRPLEIRMYLHCPNVNGTKLDVLKIVAKHYRTMADRLEVGLTSGQLVHEGEPAGEWELSLGGEFDD